MDTPKNQIWFIIPRGGLYVKRQNKHKGRVIYYARRLISNKFNYLCAPGICQPSIKELKQAILMYVPDFDFNNLHIGK